MATIGSKVLCKYLKKLTLFQFLERTIRDSYKINMKHLKDPHGPCLKGLRQLQQTSKNIY